MDLLGRIREDMALEANVWKSYVYRFLMQFQLWWPIWVRYLQEDRNLSLTQITLLDTPFFLLIVLAEVPTGAIADRFGRKTSLMLGSAMFAVAVFIFGVAENYLIIIVSYTVWGLAQTLQSGADTAMLYDSLKKLGREHEFERINSRLWALTSLAVLLAILIGAPIAALTTFSLPIILSAAIALAAFPIALSMKEPGFEVGVMPERYFQTIAHGLRDAWNLAPLRYIIMFSGILLAGTFTPLVFQQPFLAEHGVGTAGLGVWQAPVRAAGIVSALLTGWFLLRFGQRGAFFALPIMLGISNFALAGIDHGWAFAGFLGMGFVAGVQNPMLAAYINKRIPSERRATMLSVQNLVGNLVFAVVQPLAGVLADGFGLRAVFLAFGVGIIVLGGIVLYLWQRAENDLENGETLLEPASSTARDPVAAS